MRLLRLCTNSYERVFLIRWFSNVFSFCKSGQGVNISANKNKKNLIGALIYDIKSLEMSN